MSSLPDALAWWIATRHPAVVLGVLAVAFVAGWCVGRLKS